MDHEVIIYAVQEGRFYDYAGPLLYKCYSGKRGIWCNNPEYEAEANYGPIPRGRWTFGAPYERQDWTALNPTDPSRARCVGALRVPHPWRQRGERRKPRLYRRSPRAPRAVCVGSGRWAQTNPLHRQLGRITSDPQELTRSTATRRRPGDIAGRRRSYRRKARLRLFSPDTAFASRQSAGQRAPRWSP